MANRNMDKIDDTNEVPLDSDSENAEQTEESAADAATVELFEEAEKEKKSSSKNWKQLLETEEAVRYVYLGFGFFSILLLMVLLQFSTQAICCGDWDGYYHIRWSALVWENFKQFKWLPEFTWLPLTVLNSGEYADHHFLFHLLQIPFLWFFGPVMAAKVAAVFYGTLAIFSVYWVLFRYKVNYLLLWLAALLTCSNPFFYRMNMAKAPPLTIIYSVIGIYLLFERKYIWLMPLMFVFVWTYSLFPLLFLAALIWAAIVGWNEKKLEWQPVAYTFAGMVLGNVINPYFPNNIILFFRHFAMKFRGSYQVSVGGEWYPYDGWQFVTHLTIALVAMLMGYILFKPKNGQLPEKATFFLVFATVLLIWMFKSKRLAEYFPPFAILFGAFSWKSFFAPAAPLLPEDFARDIGPYLDADKGSEEQELKNLFKSVVPWVLAAFFIFLMFYNFYGINIKSLGLEQKGLLTVIRENEKDDKYAEAMEWASANIPEGETIFNCNWDDFPKMFFLDTKHKYVYGLDPNYLYSQDPELYKLVKDITGGKIEDPGPVIVEKFDSRYVFSDAKENEDFLAKLLESGWADTVY
ncbi:MAG: hypothetical protein HKN25_07025, partial [Pyrinomonadaceae bacterium]|nr:hypothetical protein [Pyrinomonadaceae bacterium]